MPPLFVDGRDKADKPASRLEWDQGPVRTEPERFFLDIGRRTMAPIWRGTASGLGRDQSPRRVQQSHRGQVPPVIGLASCNHAPPWRRTARPAVAVWTPKDSAVAFMVSPPERVTRAMAPSLSRDEMRRGMGSRGGRAVPQEYWGQCVITRPDPIMGPRSRPANFFSHRAGRCGIVIIQMIQWAIEGYEALDPSRLRIPTSWSVFVWLRCLHRGIGHWELDLRNSRFVIDAL